MSIHHLIGSIAPLGRGNCTRSLYMCETCSIQRARHNREERLDLYCVNCDTEKVQPVEEITLRDIEIDAAEALEAAKTLPEQFKKAVNAALSGYAGSLASLPNVADRMLNNAVANMRIHPLPTKRTHASKSTVIGCNKLQPAEMIWLGRALDALTDLNLHIPSTLTLAELRETVKRIHTQAWQCLRIVQTRPLSKKVKKREKSRLFTIANKLRPLA